MPLPTSGPLSLSMIRTEFGGAAPDSLSEYYAGGVNVPSGTTGVNGAVPASGVISFSHFYGTSKTLPLSVTSTPNRADGVFTNSPAAGTPPTRVVTSVSTTASASGGTPGYTYAWTRISGSTAITATSSTGPTTSFSGEVPIDTFVSAVFRVTVTDAQSQTATFDVPVELNYLSGF